MARVFRGSFPQKVDGKGRVSIPAPFRRVLEADDPDWKTGTRPKFVIVFGGPEMKYLECYSVTAINEVDARITMMQRGTDERRAAETLIYSQSLEAEVDEDGRIVLPQRLRDKIDLGPEAFFAGTADTFQIWKPETYEADAGARVNAVLNNLPAGHDVLSLLPELPKGV